MLGVDHGISQQHPRIRLSIGKTRTPRPGSSVVTGVDCESWMPTGHRASPSFSGQGGLPVGLSKRGCSAGLQYGLGTLVPCTGSFKSTRHDGHLKMVVSLNVSLSLSLQQFQESRDHICPAWILK